MYHIIIVHIQTYIPSTSFLFQNIKVYEPIVVGLDLSEINAIDQVVLDIYKLCGYVDILINNGGISSRGCILDTSLHVHTTLMNVNHFGPVALTKGTEDTMKWF